MASLTSNPKDPKPECRSLRWDKSTWHTYEPIDGKTCHFRDYVERCTKCGKERTGQWMI